MESDWKHFSAIVSMLRDRYIAACNARILGILSDPNRHETEQFRDALEEMKKEAKVLRDCLDGHSRSRMWLYLLTMIGAGMIKREDTAGFSEELLKELSHACDRKEGKPSA
ncbi:MAG: hypothetical protein V4710_02990 [Verrucomicrobiota bacterium]